MTQRQMLLISGAAVFAFVLIVGVGTYPRWGMILRQSEGK